MFYTNFAFRFSRSNLLVFNVLLEFGSLWLHFSLFFFVCFSKLISLLTFACVCGDELEGLSNTLLNGTSVCVCVCFNRKGAKRDSWHTRERWKPTLLIFCSVEDYDDTTTTMTRAYVWLRLANFILVYFFFFFAFIKKLRTKANFFSSFVCVCLCDYDICLIIDFCFVLRMLNFFFV